jgi:hypothetical protein
MTNTTITLQPGDQIIIKVADAPSPAPSAMADPPEGQRHQDLDGSRVLPVPYIRQHGPGADHAPGDCGPACVAMAVHFLTDHEPSVNAVSLAGGVPEDAYWSSLQQNAQAARFYGLKARHVRPLTRERITKEIAAGFPVLALVKYDLLSTDDDPNQDAYAGAHFVLIVGYASPPEGQSPDGPLSGGTEGGRGTVILHDPNRLCGDEFGAFRELPWSVFNKAHGSTDKTPGNSYNYHGITFDV